jgi:hypothetical protein
LLYLRFGSDFHTSARWKDEVEFFIARSAEPEVLEGDVLAETVDHTDNTTVPEVMQFPPAVWIEAAIDHDYKAPINSDAADRRKVGSWESLPFAATPDCSH